MGPNALVEAHLRECEGNEDGIKEVETISSVPLR